MTDPSVFNRYRITSGPLATQPEDGAIAGAFHLGDTDDKNVALLVKISTRNHWEHVCVEKFRNKFMGKPVREEPTAHDMRLVKDLFFKPEENCVEFFPHAKSVLHAAPFTRHLWRHQIRDFPMPESMRKLTQEEMVEKLKLIEGN